jgi:hypothetical protein
MTDMDRLPPRVVCAALDIPIGTLGTWAKRGYFANFDAAVTSKGQARLFTLTDALALALVKAASKYSLLHLPELSSFAPNAAEDWLTHRGAVRELVVRYYPAERDMASIRYNDDAMKDPPEAGAEVAFTLNLDVILGNAHEALKARLRQPDAVASDLKMEELNPSLTEISRVYSPSDRSDD